ncbi:UNVERIFIED_CONTAM: hypothetical protein PYX00_009933 [Menopon gallinae]|uniref:H15 domain-containing protein n=1 Tax=Menopon gallinae TaxID=328185 RepID=A0AAW2HD78_9NEOP
MAAKDKGKDTKKAKRPAHPKTAEMVAAAIKDLKERGGSSLHAIKKYIAATYQVDAEKLAPFIRKHLRAAVNSGTLIQITGKGASGSFKLAKTDSKRSTEARKRARATASGSARSDRRVKTTPKRGPSGKSRRKKKKKPTTPRKGMSPKKGAIRPKIVKSRSESDAPRKKKKKSAGRKKPRTPTKVSRKKKPSAKKK